MNNSRTAATSAGASAATAAPPSSAIATRDPRRSSAHGSFVTRDFELTGAATDPYGNKRIGLDGTTTVNRKDWGVN